MNTVILLSGGGAPWTLRTLGGFLLPLLSLLFCFDWCFYWWYLSLVFMVQGPPGAQGHTGPRGFKGRRVNLTECWVKLGNVAAGEVGLILYFTVNPAGISRASRIWRRARCAGKSRTGGTPRPSYPPWGESNHYIININQTTPLQRFELFQTFLSNHFRATSCHRWLQVSMRNPVCLGWCQERGWATQQEMFSTSYLKFVHDAQQCVTVAVSGWIRTTRTSRITWITSK